MSIRELFERDDAVSPVIGVILMVAITVILAAVIASFVLNVGEEAQQSPPQASLQFSYDTSGDGTVTITHESGQTLDASSLSVTVTDDSGSTRSHSTSGGFSGSLSAGDSFDVTLDSGSFNRGDNVRIVWNADSGSASSIFAEFEVPQDA